MTRTLLLGGYGGFGGRIARRLVSAGHEVLVAGRSIEKARAFCGDAPDLRPLAMDRSQIATALKEHKPDMVVDASGPFQAMDHTIPKACIVAGVHYIDIANSRDFVCGIRVLDEAARAAGVVVLSGASSVPALSGATVRHLAQGMDRVRSVEMAISVSNKATAGPAVSAAIPGQVGQPMRIWRGQRWAKAFEWQEMRSVIFRCVGIKAISGRRAPPSRPGFPVGPCQLGTLSVPRASWFLVAYCWTMVHLNAKRSGDHSGKLLNMCSI